MYIPTYFNLGGQFVKNKNSANSAQFFLQLKFHGSEVHFISGFQVKFWKSNLGQKCEKKTSEFFQIDLGSRN